MLTTTPPREVDVNYVHLRGRPLAAITAGNHPRSLISRPGKWMLARLLLILTLSGMPILAISVDVFGIVPQRISAIVIVAMLAGVLAITTIWPHAARSAGGPLTVAAAAGAAEPLSGAPPRGSIARPTRDHELRDTAQILLDADEPGGGEKRWDSAAVENADPADRSAEFEPLAKQEGFAAIGCHDRDATTGGEYPDHFMEHSERLGHEVQSGKAADRIECAVVEREIECIAAHVDSA